MSLAEDFAAIKDAVAARVPESVREKVEEFLKKTVVVESGGDVNAKSSTSSASGAFQMTKQTAAAYHAGTTIESQSRAAANLTMDNMATLQAKLGREPSLGELYLAHFSGDTTAAKIIKAAEKNPNTPISELLSEKAIAANKAITFNGKHFGDSNFNASDLTGWAAKKMGTHVEFDNNPAPSVDEKKKETKDREDLLAELHLENLFGDSILGQFFMMIVKMVLSNAKPSNELGKDVPQPQLPAAAPQTPVVQPNTLAQKPAPVKSTNARA